MSLLDKTAIILRLFSLQCVEWVITYLCKCLCCKQPSSYAAYFIVFSFKFRFCESSGRDTETDVCFQLKLTVNEHCTNFLTLTLKKEIAYNRNVFVTMFSKVREISLRLKCTTNIDLELRFRISVKFEENVIFMSQNLCVINCIRIQITVLE